MTTILVPPARVARVDMTMVINTMMMFIMMMMMIDDDVPSARVVRADPLHLYLVVMMNRAPASQACEVYC